MGARRLGTLTPHTLRCLPLYLAAAVSPSLGLANRIRLKATQASWLPGWPASKRTGHKHIQHTRSRQGASTRTSGPTPAGILGRRRARFLPDYHHHYSRRRLAGAVVCCHRCRRCCCCCHLNSLNINTMAQRAEEEARERASESRETTATISSGGGNHQTASKTNPKGDRQTKLKETINFTVRLSRRLRRLRQEGHQGTSGRTQTQRHLATHSFVSKVPPQLAPRRLRARAGPSRPLNLSGAPCSCGRLAGWLAGLPRRPSRAQIQLCSARHSNNNKKEGAGPSLRLYLNGLIADGRHSTSGSWAPMAASQWGCRQGPARPCLAHSIHLECLSRAIFRCVRIAPSARARGHTDTYIHTRI